jgi:hypothetical protein
VIFFKKKLQKFWQNQKLPYLCIVDVGNTTENKDVSTPISQSERLLLGVSTKDVSSPISQSERQV